MYTHRRGTKAYEKTSVAHAWAHVKNMWFKLRYWLMFFPWFFSSVFCSSPVASLNGKRSYPTPAGLWLPFSWLLIPLRVQSSEAQIAAGYTWKDRRVDLNIFSVFFSDVRFIFVMYLLKCIYNCDVLRFLCSGCQSAMLLYVQNGLRIPLIVTVCISFWRAACDACPSVIASSEVLQETQHFFRPSLGYWFRFKASTFDNFALGNGHCEGRGA